MGVIKMEEVLMTLKLSSAASLRNIHFAPHREKPVLREKSQFAIAVCVRGGLLWNSE
jgi:hypothetical protein